MNHLNENVKNAWLWTVNVFVFMCFMYAVGILWAQNAADCIWTVFDGNCSLNKWMRRILNELNEMLCKAWSRCKTCQNRSVVCLFMLSLEVFWADFIVAVMRVDGVPFYEMLCVNRANENRLHTTSKLHKSSSEIPFQGTNKWSGFEWVFVFVCFW